MNDGENEKISKEIDCGLYSIGINSCYNMDDDLFAGKNIRSDKRLGVCRRCYYLRAAKKEFGEGIYFCTIFDKNLNLNDKIVECTAFEDHNAMSIRDMQAIAYIIDNDKRRAGFIKDE